MQTTLMLALLLLCGGPALQVRAAPRQVDSDQSQQVEDAEDASDGVSFANSILAALIQTQAAILNMRLLEEELNAAAVAVQESKQSNYVLPTPGIYTVPGKKSIQWGRDGNSGPNLSAVCRIARRLLSSDMNSESRRRLLKEVWRRCQDQAA